MKQSEKVQKNKEPLQSSSNNSVSQTKHEITPRPNERIDIELFDFWVDNLDCDTQQSLLSFAEETFSVIQIYLYAKFLGYRGSITSCEAWVNKKYPKPDHLRVLLFEIDEMQEDIRKLRLDIENYAVKRDSGVARIAAMQKELRSTISQVNTFVSVKDKKSLLLTGADRALRELQSIFKDDIFEEPLREASLSVWAKIQYED